MTTAMANATCIEGRPVAGPPAVVAAALAMLDQCSAFVSAMSSAAYVHESRVLKGGTIGKHVRHTLDHFRAALDGGEGGGVVDYDHRTRNVPMEADRGAALEAIRQVRERLMGITDGMLVTGVRVCVMLSGDGSRTEVASTLGRELAFASHHAVHHHAMLNAIAAELGISTECDFGKAPSTICHERCSGSR